MKLTSRNWPRLIAVVLVFASAGATGIGCGDQSEDRKDSRSLNQRVLALDYGVSLEDAKDELGAPRSEFSNGDEATLNYVRWRLRFVDNALEEKRRERRPDGKRLEGKALNRRVVVTLKRGVTIDSVKATLGEPDLVEHVYESTEDPYLVLWYGPWELTFRSGRLTHRTSY